MTTRAVEFDSGPLHEAILLVPLDQHGELPGVVWTDEGDFPSTYVLDEVDGAQAYAYVGERWESERDCPYIDANRRAPQDGVGPCSPEAPGSALP